MIELVEIDHSSQRHLNPTSVVAPLRWLPYLTVEPSHWDVHSVAALSRLTTLQCWPFEEVKLRRLLFPAHRGIFQ